MRRCLHGVARMDKRPPPKCQNHCTIPELTHMVCRTWEVDKAEAAALDGDVSEPGSAKASASLEHSTSQEVPGKSKACTSQDTGLFFW